MPLISVNCNWSQWTQWETCSSSCGVGTQLRSRYFEEIAKNGGLPCSGEVAESKTCNLELCPPGKVNNILLRLVFYPSDHQHAEIGLKFSVNCTYTEWSVWGSCTVTCGEGSRMRTRNMDNLPLNGGKPCTDPLAEIERCGEICGKQGEINT